MAATIRVDDSFPLSTRLKEDFPYATYADSKYPLLRIAASNQSKAHSYKVEWLCDSPEEREVWVNYTQIFRTPFTPTDDSDRELYRALERHLQDVEDTLWHGTPNYNASGAHPIGFCGGVLHYLGRPPLYEDHISLRVMQDLILLKDRGEGSSVVHEFLSEISLEVRPCIAIRPYKKPTSKNAWAQGSSLSERDPA